MTPLSKSIILIGFKHVGKSALGYALALRLAKPFIDLDAEIEREFQEQYTCRQIMHIYGQAYFRDLEKKLLTQVMQADPAIIALGGGTPLDLDNQALIRHHTVVHVVAPRDLVFARIMKQGRPEFFPAEKPPLETFHQLWDEREAIYKSLASVAVENNGLLVSAVEQMLQHLQVNKHVKESL